jgi:hypothetical protein
MTPARWLESQGYDVTYQAGVDTDRQPAAALLRHRLFLSVGHDEYWSGAQRAAVERARDAGLNLAFFSGNEVFWRVRWEDGHRTMVVYKESQELAKKDPMLDVRHRTSYLSLCLYLYLFSTCSSPLGVDGHLAGRPANQPSGSAARECTHRDNIHCERLEARRAGGALHCTALHDAL